MAPFRATRFASSHVDYLTVHLQQRQQWRLLLILLRGDCGEGLIESAGPYHPILSEMQKIAR
jgi:hypothetical protein